jgi:hypothetical protein
MLIDGRMPRKAGETSLRASRAAVGLESPAIGGELNRIAPWRSCHARRVWSTQMQQVPLGMVSPASHSTG